MDVDPKHTADFRNACHNFFNHPQINLVITGGLTLAATYLSWMAVFHRWTFFPLWEDASLSSFPNYYELRPIEFSYSATVVFIVYVISLITCKIADIAWLKPALGPIIFGVMIRNISSFEVLLIRDAELDLILRYVGLTLLLIRCGLRLNTEIIAESWALPISLSLGAALLEVVAVVLASHLIFGLELFTAFTLGFLLSATACSSLLPTMRYFQSMNQGSNKSIPALILTSSALDNIMCICIPTIFLAIQFTTVSLVTQIFIIIGETVLAILIGIVVGGLLWYFPRQQDSYKHFARVLALFAAATAMIFGAARINVLFAGVIATLAATITAQKMWRADHDGETVDDDYTVEARWFCRLWQVFAEPLVFVLLGMQLDFALLSWPVFLSGLAVVAIGVAIRTLVTFVFSFASDLNTSEKLFTVLASLPKGSFQAAFASTLTALLATDPSLSPWIPLVLSALVSSAAIVGSLGHLCIRVFGPFLLQYDFPETVHIANPNHNSYVETVKVTQIAVDENSDNLVTFKQFKTIEQVQAEGRRPYEF